MKKLIVFGFGLLAISAATAENLAGVDEMICSVAKVKICLESGECYAADPVDLSIPDFVVINTRSKTVATTKSSELNRSTGFDKVEKEDGLVFLQGIEGGRAFSFVIDEATGRMTVAVSRDGFSVSVFGACANTDI